MSDREWAIELINWLAAEDPERRNRDTKVEQKVAGGYGAIARPRLGCQRRLPLLRPLRRSLTGPVALAISIIALMATGGTLVFGGELHDFTRRACQSVLAIAFLVAGASFMNILFNVAGALI